MKYDIPWKPTTFRGVRYRSRLEARKALLCYLLGIDAWYEPRYLRRRGWQPDFLIEGLFRQYVAEVKPVRLAGCKMIPGDGEFAKAILHCKEGERVALIGDGPFASEDGVALGFELFKSEQLILPLVVYRNTTSNAVGLGNRRDLWIRRGQFEPVRPKDVLPLWNKTRKHFHGERMEALPVDHFVPDLAETVL